MSFHRNTYIIVVITKGIIKAKSFWIFKFSLLCITVNGKKNERRIKSHIMCGFGIKRIRMQQMEALVLLKYSFFLHFFVCVEHCFLKNIEFFRRNKNLLLRVIYVLGNAFLINITRSCDPYNHLQLHTHCGSELLPRNIVLPQPSWYHQQNCHRYNASNPSELTPITKNLIVRTSPMLRLCFNEKKLAKRLLWS